MRFDNGICSPVVKRITLVQAGRRSVITNIQARYANGVLRLLEPVDLEEGKEVVVSIEDATSQSNG